MIKVTRLPNDMNIDNRIRKKMLEVYGTCPYCNNTLREEDVNYDYYYNHPPYGYQKDSLGRTWKEVVDYEIKDAGEAYIGGKSKLFNHLYKWKKIIFTCEKCGMEWEAPKYPLVGDDADANTAIFHAWEQGKDMEVNTLLLSVMKE